jgi:hypothetical protein
LGDVLEDEPVKARSLDHGLRIGHPGVEREVFDVPAAGLIVL